VRRNRWQCWSHGAKLAGWGGAGRAAASRRHTWVEKTAQRL
jgi:hypothetical protein